MSTAINVSLEGQERTVKRLNRLLAGVANPRPALEAIGAVVESQTRRRIEDGGPSPDGTPWDAWSRGYAATRHGGQALLRGDGGLMDSIDWVADDDSVQIGSNLVYAAIHQFGGEDDMPAGPAGIPARPYLGLSDDDAEEVLDELNDYLARLADA